jgi:hypothetical protein
MKRWTIALCEFVAGLALAIICSCALLAIAVGQWVRDALAGSSHRRVPDRRVEFWTSRKPHRRAASLRRVS